YSLFWSLRIPDENTVQVPEGCELVVNKATCSAKMVLKSDKTKDSFSNSHLCGFTPVQSVGFFLILASQRQPTHHLYRSTFPTMGGEKNQARVYAGVAGESDPAALGPCCSWAR
ncbi:hypothetical protein GBF38_002205, partial [Nibea albiflora]